MTEKHFGCTLRRAVLGLLLAVCAAFFVLPAWAADEAQGAEAIAKLEQQLAEQERTLGKEHLEVAKTLNELAQKYSEWARYADAERLFERALAISEKQGAAHADVAQSLHGLGELYVELEDYERAEPLLLHAREIREKHLGAEHPDTAKTLNMLGVLYTNLEEYVKAEPFLRQALVILEKVHGPNHPDVAKTLSIGLVNWYQNQDRYAESEPLAQRALAIQEGVLGANHPDVSDSLADIATVLYHHKDYETAERLALRAFDIAEKAYGTEHPMVASRLGGLSSIFIKQGKEQFTNAKAIREKALAINEKAYGVEHIAVARSLGRLAYLSIELEEYAEAEKYSQRALAIFERHMNQYSGAAATLMHNMAYAYREQKKYGEAERWFKHALEIYEEKYGPGHEKSAETLVSLAITHSLQKQYSEAEKLYLQVLAIPGVEPADTLRYLYFLADMYDDWGRHTEAAAQYQRILAMEEKRVGTESLELVRPLQKLALSYEAGRNYSEALPLYQRVLAIHEKHLGSTSIEVADSQVNLAQCYEKQRQYRKAERLYLRALAIREKSGNGLFNDRVAASQERLARLYNVMGQPTKSKRFKALAQQRLDEAERLKASVEQMENEAQQFETQNQQDQALRLRLQVLASQQRLLGSAHWDTIKTWRNVVRLQMRLGQYPQAISQLEQLLPAQEKTLGLEHPDLLMTMRDLAHLYELQGQYGKAEPLFRRTVEFREKILQLDFSSMATKAVETAPPEVTWAQQDMAASKWPMAMLIMQVENKSSVVQELNDMAYLYRHNGQYAKAIAALQRAKTYDNSETTLNNLAVMHHVLGQHDRAEAILQRISGGANVLNNKAVLLGLKGEYAGAEQLFRQALDLLERENSVEKRLDMVRVMSNLAALYENHQEQHDLAEPLLRKALEIREAALLPGHPDVASSLNALALLHMNKGQRDQAEQLYQQALPMAERSENPEIKWAILGALRDFYADSNPNLAIFYGKQAVNTLQSVRAVNVGLDRAMRQSFLKSRESHYTELADLLFAQGRLFEGEQVLTMLKESEYHEFTNRSTPEGARTDMTEREKKHHARYQEMSGSLVALAKEHSALANRGDTGMSEAEKARKAQLQEQLAGERGKFAAMLKEIERDFAALGGERQREFDEKSIQQLDRMAGTLKDLGHGAALLSYLVAEKRLWIVLTTAEGKASVARQVDISAVDLGKKIGAFRTAIKERRDSTAALGRELHELLLAPVAEDLRQAGAQTLMLSLDGALRYLPFAALHDGEQYLAQRYALAIYTEVAKDKLQGKQQQEWRLAGFGVTREWPGHDRLDAVRAELDGIKATAPDDSSVLYDGEFTADSFRRALNRKPPVVHVASHFTFRPGTERDSYLLLGDGTHLALNRVREEYRFDGVDLVALSACQTAMGGGENGRGREVEGLGVMVQDLGAKSVLASLWAVNDKSTADLMQRFYRYRQQGLTKAEALQKAQQDFINLPDRGTDCEPGGKNCTLRGQNQPYHWAPFILMGNWL